MAQSSMGLTLQLILIVATIAQGSNQQQQEAGEGVPNVRKPGLPAALRRHYQFGRPPHAQQRAPQRQQQPFEGFGAGTPATPPVTAGNEYGRQPPAGPYLAIEADYRSAPSSYQQTFTQQAASTYTGQQPAATPYQPQSNYQPTSEYGNKQPQTYGEQTTAAPDAGTDYGAQPHPLAPHALPPPPRRSPARTVNGNGLGWDALERRRRAKRRCSREARGTAPPEHLLAQQSAQRRRVAGVANVQDPAPSGRQHGAIGVVGPEVLGHRNGRLRQLERPLEDSADWAYAVLPPPKGVHIPTVNSRNLPSVDNAHRYYYPPRMPLPLPTCFHNPTGYPCCNPALNDLMVETYTDLEAKPKFHTCNINAIAQHLQIKAEEKFNTSFETVAAFDDFAQKIHFHGDLVCKVELGGKYMLAYATVKDAAAVLPPDAEDNALGLGGLGAPQPAPNGSGPLGSGAPGTGGNYANQQQLARQKRQSTVGPQLPLPPNDLSRRYSMWV